MEKVKRYVFTAFLLIVVFATHEKDYVSNSIIVTCPQSMYHL